MQDEFTTIKRAIRELGPGSYLGTWLREQLPGIRALIRDDYRHGPARFATWHAAQQQKEDALQLREDNLRGKEARQDAREEHFRAKHAMAVRLIAGALRDLRA